MENTNLFNKTHKKALQFYHSATTDYLGARCCLINCIIYPGHFLAAQAIEKMLKCLILLLSPNEDFTKRVNRIPIYPSHDLGTLLQSLQSISHIDLGNFVNLCNHLTVCYKVFRYPDSKNELPHNFYSLSTKIIHEVDELFFVLFDNLQLPDKVNCRVGLLGILLFDNLGVQIKWLTLNNAAYQKRINIVGRPLSWWETDEASRTKSVVSIEVIKP